MRHLDYFLWGDFIFCFVTVEFVVHSPKETHDLHLMKQLQVKVSQ